MTVFDKDGGRYVVKLDGETNKTLKLKPGNLVLGSLTRRQLKPRESSVINEDVEWTDAVKVDTCETCNTDKDDFEKRAKTSGIMVAVDNDGYALMMRELYRSEGKQQAGGL